MGDLSIPPSLLPSSHSSSSLLVAGIGREQQAVAFSWLLLPVSHGLGVPLFSSRYVFRKCTLFKTVSSSVSFLLLLLLPCFFSTDCSFSLFTLPPLRHTHAKVDRGRPTDATDPGRGRSPSAIIVPPLLPPSPPPFGEARLECLKVGTPLDGGGRSSTSTSSPLSPSLLLLSSSLPPFCFARVYVQY